MARRSADALARVAGAIVAAAVATAMAEPITLHTRPVAFSEEEGATVAGRLEYRGGLHVTSPDARFGGWSGLVVLDGGAALLAVSDKGYWLTARLGYRGDGTLAGISQGEIGVLMDQAGRPLTRRRRDAEEVVALPDGFAVAFEGEHRVWRYPGLAPPFAQPPDALGAPPGIARAPGNRGIEAMTALADGRVFILAEGLRAATGEVRGWVSDGPLARRWHPLGWVATGEFVPTGAARLPSGDVLVLERRFSWIGGLGSRIARLRAAAILPGARLEGEELGRLESPLVHDNFEGIAATRGPAGETLVFVVSDDNYDALLQRTLVLMFALRGGDARGAR